MSRSEFFTRAVRRYIEHLEAESLTGRINHRHPATGDGSW